MNDPGTGAAVVIKVGGSLLDWPPLGTRLGAWLARKRFPQPLLTVGGGLATDAIRAASQVHSLGEASAHWLAIRALSLNSWLLAEGLAKSRVVESFAEAENAWRRGETPIMDPLPVLRADEGRAGSLPHAWDAASDCVAARIAQIVEAEALFLLKSSTAPDGDWRRLAEKGYLDPWFPSMVDRLPPVTLVNLRDSA